jgi:hypothetical protein
MNFEEKTDFLFSTTSFIIGLGSFINIGGNYFDYNTSKNYLESDRIAISMDWKIIGNDIRNIILNNPI